MKIKVITCATKCPMAVQVVRHMYSTLPLSSEGHVQYLTSFIGSISLPITLPYILATAVTNLGCPCRHTFSLEPTCAYRSHRPNLAPSVLVVLGLLTAL